MNSGGQSPKKFDNISPKGRLLIVFVGVGLLLILALIVYAIFSNANKGDSGQILGIVQKQQELIRVADMGTNKARGATAANLAVTTKLSIVTSQKLLIDAIKGKFSSEELAKAKKADTDKRLVEAEEASRFDEVFGTVLRDQLTEYETALQTTLESSKNKKTVAILDNSLKQVEILLDKQTAQAQ